MTAAVDALETRQATLLDLLDRVVDKGVVLAGDLTISVADVDLIYVGLKVLVSSVERLESPRRGAGAPGREAGPW